ncbi:very short patch repair endonuclease [Mesorhizobium sp. ASY16-5R]|uniref:very short patch repair endonuclease n=1 Tax=Mesorhizobium sp. ASY16-5R TaxID=3445772 RepID=UPI003F9F8179
MSIDPLRSRTMAAVKSKDTRPEMIVRRLVHRLGFRFRLYPADLPGKPDLVFRSRRAVIFVNGCFWHGHGCARGARVPKTNTSYWLAKVGRNAARDISTKAALEKDGWRVLTIWECQTKDADTLAPAVRRFLLGQSPQ